MYPLGAQPLSLLLSELYQKFHLHYQSIKKGIPNCLLQFWVPLPSTHAQSEQVEWKNYLNPKHNFSLDYPDIYDTLIITKPNDDRVGIHFDTYSDHYSGISLNIEPFNSTKFKDLKGVADYLYNESIIELDCSVS